MTQEEKQILIKDLCARLPYHTKCYCKWSKEASNGTSGCIQELSTFLLDECEIMDNPEYDCQVSEIKPYLRPLSSMTDDERDKFRELGGVMSHNVQNDTWVLCAFAPEAYDWLNQHHFDYRGLIDKGLALEAPEGMYND